MQFFYVEIEIGEKHFLSQSIPWVEGKYLADHYKRFLQAINIKPEPFCSPWIHTQASKEKSILFHIGSANLTKDLPIAFWKVLYTSLKTKGYQIAFSGKGDAQKRVIEEITGHHEELNWPQFIQAIHQSALLISVDTVAVHLAAAMKTPFIVLYRATPDIPLWFPPGGAYFNKVFQPEDVAKKAMEVLNEVGH